MKGSVLIKTLSLVYFISNVVSKVCDNLECYHGRCENGTCICSPGWQGPSCQFCNGRIKLTGKDGVLMDGIGNYSHNIQCTWLIDTGVHNGSALLRFRFDHFATECGWDHLYIYDGDSVFSPLLASYSGLVVQEDRRKGKIPEILTKSGYAYIHFYSDAAYNLTGFNISYTLGSCPRGPNGDVCNGKGACVEGEGTCTCDAGMTGSACDIPICPSNCSGNGHCDREHHRCRCYQGFSGLGCEQREDVGYWSEVLSNSTSYAPLGRASHTAVIFRDELWSIGGNMFIDDERDTVIKYYVTRNVWKSLRTRPIRRGTYGHSMIVYQEKLYLFGGVTKDALIMNELWTFDLNTQKRFSQIRIPPMKLCHNQLCPPLKVVGHTAVNVKDKMMVIIFGLSPEYGYLNAVQEYDFEKDLWSIAETKGAIVKGGYGHTSVWDNSTQKIYVHGGYVSLDIQRYKVTDVLYSYDPFDKWWQVLTPSGRARFLHTASIIHGIMLVYGGNTHNDTSSSQGAKCYSEELIMYDITCDRWDTMVVPPFLYTTSARYGHSVALYKDTMYLFGGFNGEMLNDIITFKPGKCEPAKDEESCLTAKVGVKCVWDKRLQRCERLMAGNLTDDYSACPEKETVNRTMLCSSITTCPTCLSTSFNCSWCNDGCEYDKCKNNNNTIRLVKDCHIQKSSNCGHLHRCHACHTEIQCGWESDNKCYTYIKQRNENRKEITFAMMKDEQRHGCAIPCHSRITCQECTKDHCMWCNNLQVCVDNNAYIPSFPYGQCMEWTTNITYCTQLERGGTPCSGYRECKECQMNPACGWCDDGSGTGLGSCMEGNSTHPRSHPRRACLYKRWYFTTCPKCQCNGHSHCINATGECNSCMNMTMTEGKHCQHCIEGYFGNPVNGGKCTPCKCNGHGKRCDRKSGRCQCTTKGIAGKHCERCDTDSNYVGDPLQGGTCFYDLSVNYQFTFNLSKMEDLHLKQINFRNRPLKPDIDAELSIKCEVKAKMNITVKTALQQEVGLVRNATCDKGFTYTKVFSSTDYMFGNYNINTTFMVYVYDIVPPLYITVAFSQHPQLDLLQFFITFSLCFLILLLIAAALWKVKQKYEMYRRRQVLLLEMEQMASRPFAQVYLEIARKDERGIEEKPKRRSAQSKNGPSPIALEPCYGGKAAVLSVLVQLPTGGMEHTSPGQNGLCVASALVALGSPGQGVGSPLQAGVILSKSGSDTKSSKPWKNNQPDTYV